MLRMMEQDHRKGGSVSGTGDDSSLLDDCEDVEPDRQWHCLDFASPRPILESLVGRVDSDR